MVFVRSIAMVTLYLHIKRTGISSFSTGMWKIHEKMPTCNYDVRVASY